MDYRARFYSQSLGRFIQPDTIIPNPSSPQAWNRYSYVMNSPINLNDPSGHGPACAGLTGYRCKIRLGKLAASSSPHPDSLCERGYEEYCDAETLETYAVAGVKTVSPFGIGRPRMVVWFGEIFKDGVSMGRAKLFPEEVEAFGIDDPYSDQGAHDGMKERIRIRLEACTGCSDTDLFIVAALGSDYNFDVENHVNQATKKIYAAGPGEPTTINWEYYLREESGNLREKFGDLLSLFTANVLELKSQGYYVPGEVDFYYIQNILLPTIP